MGNTVSVIALALGEATVDIPHVFDPSWGPTTLIPSQ